MTALRRRIVAFFVVLWMAAVFGITYYFLWRFTGLVAPLPFWTAFAWMLVLFLLLGGVTIARLTDPGAQRARMRTGLLLKRGAALFTWVFVAINLYLLYSALTGERDDVLVRGFMIVQMLVLALYIAVMGWLFVEYYVGLPANAGIKAMHNAQRLEDYLDRIAAYAMSDWLTRERGVTAAGRLRASLCWWEEELVLAFPGRGLEMALPAVGQFLENLGREMTLLDSLYERRERAPRYLEEAERRVLHAINRAAAVAGRLQS